MKKSKLLFIKEKIEARSKKPWACFETNGIEEKGLGMGMFWNPAFIEHLHNVGIQGINDEETIQLFFLFMSGRIAEGITGEDSVNPEATPNLTNEANTLVR